MKNTGDFVADDIIKKLRELFHTPSLAVGFQKTDDGVMITADMSYPSDLNRGEIPRFVQKMESMAKRQSRIRDIEVLYSAPLLTINIKRNVSENSLYDNILLDVLNESFSENEKLLFVGYDILKKEGFAPCHVVYSVKDFFDDGDVSNEKIFEVYGFFNLTWNNENDCFSCVWPDLKNSFYIRSNLSSFKNKPVPNVWFDYERMKAPNLSFSKNTMQERVDGGVVSILNVLKEYKSNNVLLDFLQELVRIRRVDLDMYFNELKMPSHEKLKIIAALR